jgi:hypothetical protein
MDNVFELAQLVAAERQPRIAVVALGEDIHFAAERLRQPRQKLDGRRAERERVTRKFVQFEHGDDPICRSPQILAQSPRSVLSIFGQIRAGNSIIRDLWAISFRNVGLDWINFPPWIRPICAFSTDGRMTNAELAKAKLPSVLDCHLVAGDSTSSSK